MTDSPTICPPYIPSRSEESEPESINFHESLKFFQEQLSINGNSFPAPTSVQSHCYSLTSRCFTELPTQSDRDIDFGIQETGKSCRLSIPTVESILESVRVLRAIQKSQKEKWPSNNSERISEFDKDGLNSYSSANNCIRQENVFNNAISDYLDLGQEEKLNCSDVTNYEVVEEQNGKIKAKSTTTIGVSKAEKSVKDVSAALQFWPSLTVHRTENIDGKCESDCQSNSLNNIERTVVQSATPSNLDVTVLPSTETNGINSIELFDNEGTVVLSDTVKGTKEENSAAGFSNASLKDIEEKESVPSVCGDCRAKAVDGELENHILCTDPTNKFEENSSCVEAIEYEFQYKKVDGDEPKLNSISRGDTSSDENHLIESSSTDHTCRRHIDSANIKLLTKDEDEDYKSATSEWNLDHKKLNTSTIFKSTENGENSQGPSMLSAVEATGESPIGQTDHETSKSISSPPKEMQISCTSNANIQLSLSSQIVNETNVQTQIHELTNAIGEPVDNQHIVSITEQNFERDTLASDTVDAEEMSNTTIEQVSNIVVEEVSKVNATEVSNIVAEEVMKVNATEEPNIVAKEVSKVNATKVSNIAEEEVSKVNVAEVSNIVAKEVSKVDVTEVSNSCELNASENVANGVELEPSEDLEKELIVTHQFAGDRKNGTFQDEEDNAQNIAQSTKIAEPEVFTNKVTLDSNQFDGDRKRLFITSAWDLVSIVKLLYKLPEIQIPKPDNCSHVGGEVATEKEGTHQYFCSDCQDLECIPLVHYPLKCHQNVVVVDLGSCSVRAGILMDQPTLPSLFFPSVCATNRITGEHLYGEEALQSEVRRNSTISFPLRPSVKIIKHSIDVEKVSSIFKKIFRDLRIDPSNYKVQVCLPRSLSVGVQSALVETLLEDIQVQSVCLAHQAIFTMYAHDASTGVVVDVGDRMDILPVIDGFIVESGVTRLPIGGQRLIHHMKHALAQKHISLSNDLDSFVVQFIAENICFVASDYEEEKRLASLHPDFVSKSVDLGLFTKDKNCLQCATLDEARFSVPEGLFNPDLWGLDSPGIHKLVQRAIQAASVDARKRVAQNIFVSGGVTLTPGFVDRLRQEITRLNEPRITPKVYASNYRYHCTFIGACKFARMEAFNQVCVSRQEYAQNPASALKKFVLCV